MLKTYFKICFLSTLYIGIRESTGNDDVYFRANIIMYQLFTFIFDKAIHYQYFHAYADRKLR